MDQSVGSPQTWSVVGVRGPGVSIFGLPHTVDFFGFVTKRLSEHLLPQGYWGCTITPKKIYYLSDNNHSIISPKLKRTFSSLKNHRSLNLALALALA